MIKGGTTRGLWLTKAIIRGGTARGWWEDLMGSPLWILGWCSVMTHMVREENRVTNTKNIVSENGHDPPLGLGDGWGAFVL